jgi:hypothetical protein
MKNRANLTPPDAHQVDEPDLSVYDALLGQA